MCPAWEETGVRMSMGGFPRQVAVRVSTQPWLRSVALWRARRSVNVVYLHHMGKPAPHNAALFSGCGGAHLVQMLRQIRAHFDFISLSELLAMKSERKTPRTPVVALTFDDGQDPTGAGVFEILARYRISATAFLITSCIDNRKLMWRNKLSVIVTTVPGERYVAEYNRMAFAAGYASIRNGGDLLRRSMEWDMARKDEIASDLWIRCGLAPEAEYLDRYRPYFTTRRLREWLAAGHSIGFHTHTHPLCSRLSSSALEVEVIRPALELKRLLGITELPMSYPFSDRLPRGLEEDVFERGIFSAIFGSEGFRGRSTSNSRLARLGLEGGDVEHLILGASLLR